MLVAGDRFAMKVNYFDTRIDNMMFLMLEVIPPRTDPYGRFANLANVNNQKQVRYRGVEYQLDYDLERVYANFTYTRLIGQNTFCGPSHFMGGATKAISAPHSEKYLFVNDAEANKEVRCNFIVGNATYTPADKGSVTLGARFFEKKLDVGLRARYSAGYGKDLDKGANRQRWDLAAWPSYIAYDLYGSYAVTKKLSAFLALENATDEAYFVPKADFENLAIARGRTLTGTLQYSF